MSITDDKLSGVIKELNYLSSDKLSEAETLAVQEKSTLSDTLLRHNFLKESDIGKVVAFYYQVPFVELEKINIPDDLLYLTPPDLASAYKTVAYELDKSGLHIATNRPELTDLFDMLAKKAGASKPIVTYASDSGISSALRLYKRSLQTVMDEMVAAAQAGTLQISDLVDQLFNYAYDAYVSDVHIEPLSQQTVIRFRIDGVLHDEAFFPKKLHEQIVARIKVLAGLRTDEHLSAQDGRMQVSVRDINLDVRISIVPLVSGEKVVMRLLAHDNQQFTLSDLGMNQDDLELVEQSINRPYGMILSTGPTGSGKTTTIYSILKVLNTRDRNIASIEDPIEYEIDGANQVQVNQKSNLTFSEGLRSLLRQDPDVLFVGEIRDEETAAITVNSAMSGHLVLSTIHTNDAVTTLPRLIDMGIESYLVASTVNLIIAQRLVRQICNYCKASLRLTRKGNVWSGDEAQTLLLNSLGKTTLSKHFGVKTELRVYKGNGCSVCHNTGYVGRLGIFEILEVTPKLAQLISAKEPTEKLTAQALNDGMITMLDDGLDKALSGQTTLSEIMRVTNI